MAVSTSDRSLTFLFTDVEGSTRLWEEHPEAMADRARDPRSDRARRRRPIRRSDLLDGGGFLRHCLATVGSAVGAGLELQRQLSLQTWPGTGALRVRCGIHSGPVQRRGDDYFGPTLNRCARLMAIASGSQVLVSGPTAQLAQVAMPAGCGLLDLGRHRLKDLEEPEHVYQLTHADLPEDFPPLRSLGSFAANLPIYPSSFIGRADALAALGPMLGAHRIVTLVGPGGVDSTTSQGRARHY